MVRKIKNIFICWGDRDEYDLDFSVNKLLVGYSLDWNEQSPVIPEQDVLE